MDLSKDQTTQIEKILYRFQSSKNITDLMFSLLQEVSVLEDTFTQLYNERNLQDAVGVQLDQIGKLIGEDRQGRDDEEYRKYLYIRTFVNNSNGTISDLEQVILKTEDASFIQIFSHYPASIYIYIKTPTIPDDSLKDLIEEMLPAGVSLGYIGYWEEDNTLPAFIPYDEELALQLFQLSNGNFLELSDGTLLQVNTVAIPDNIEEAYLAEDPVYELNASHSILIENL